MYCEYCGTKIENSNSCPSCQKPVINQNTPKLARKANKKVIIIICAVVAVIALGFGVERYNNFYDDTIATARRYRSEDENALAAMQIKKLPFIRSEDNKIALSITCAAEAGGNWEAFVSSRKYNDDKEPVTWSYRLTLLLSGVQNCKEYDFEHAVDLEMEQNTVSYYEYYYYAALKNFYGLWEEDVDILLAMPLDDKLEYQRQIHERAFEMRNKRTKNDEWNVVEDLQLW